MEISHLRSTHHSTRDGFSKSNFYNLLSSHVTNLINNKPGYHIIITKPHSQAIPYSSTLTPTLLLSYYHTQITNITLQTKPSAIHAHPLPTKGSYQPALCPILPSSLTSPAVFNNSLSASTSFIPNFTFLLLSASLSSQS